MKIKNIKTWSVDLGNTKPYTIAFKTVDEVKNAFVQITLENGTTGIGAGNPSEYVTGESFEQCEKALHENNLDFLVGRDIRELNQLLYEVLVRFPKNPAARAALDIALHDVFTKHLNIPLVKFLGQKITSMPTSNTIGIKNVEDTLKEAQEYGDRGFTVLKVKLGKDLEEDVERLVKLREKFGKRFTIRIDANQGYTVEQTIAFAKRTAQLDVELIEQPLPAKQDFTAPVAAGIFNIKLMKCGGVREALRIADIAALQNIELFWGCNDESIVSITAALHAAFSCAHTKYIDLDGSLDLARDVVRGGFVLKDGVMYCSDKPGLGVEPL